MRDPQQRRRGWPDRALPLLLALALGACGGGDERAAAADSAQVAENRGRSPAGGGAPDCPPPPVLPDSVLRGSWASLLGWLSQEGVTFPATPDNVAVGAAPLFVNTLPVQLQLQSTAQTYCLTGNQASERRIAGMMILLQDFPGSGPLPPMSQGDSIFLFSRGSPGAQQPATLVYRQADAVAQFPGPAGWMFIYCSDGHTNTQPASQFRTVADTQAVQTSPAGGGAAGAAQGSPPGGEGPGGGTYSWLACANGCCQFYTPPPTGGGDSIPPPPPFCTPSQ
jgi:hypothetical protein